MRMIKLTIAVTAIAALGVAFMPMTAGAANSSALSAFEKKQNKKIKKALKKANRALDKVANLEDDLASQNTAQNNTNASQDERIAGVESTVATIVAGVPDIVNGLTALEAGLVAVGDGLTQLQAALEDPTTGLVGLNNARPQFAAFGDGGGLIGSTGQQGSKGPTGNATALGNGAYIVDFNNDVASRFLTVNVFPDAGGSMYTGQAVTCTAATATCDAASVPAADYDENVLVTIQGQPGGPGTAVVPSNPVGGAWSVAAISG